MTVYFEQPEDYETRMAMEYAHENAVLSATLFVNEHGRKIEKLKLNRTQMLENGFPVEVFNRIHIEPNEYQKNRKMYFEKDDTSRVCNRCKTTFQVEKNGKQITSQEPICKDQRGFQYNFHIHDQQPVENLGKFQKSPKVDSTNYFMSSAIFALDVEMVYTSHGQEVGRVTLVDFAGNVPVDLIVRTENEVYDPVTEYSGLTKEILNESTCSLEMARQAILGYINELSILIGHGLYGDLKALGIVHSSVIDTSVIYSNQGRRPSLRHLAANYLNMNIQDRGASGHCSEEDALAALNLVYYAVVHPEALAQKHMTRRLQCSMF